MTRRLLSLTLTPAALRRLDQRRLIRAGRLSIGAHSYGVPDFDTFDHDETRVEIGKFTSIASGVRFILGGNHPVDRLTTFPLRIKLGLPLAGQDGYPYSSGDIHVGSDVWIATGVTVLSGVRIGDGAVIAAGSLVSRDVEPYSIVAGSPAKLVRKRFADDVIASMLEIAWWDWPLDKVVEATPLLSDADVGAFVRKYA